MAQDLDIPGLFEMASIVVFCSKCKGHQLAMEKEQYLFQQYLLASSLAGKWQAAQKAEKQAREDLRVALAEATAALKR